MINASKRLFFMDNLKTFIVCLMIVFHIAMCYMAYAPEWWYVVDQEHNHLFFTCMILWADVFIMPIMFFVAGYFGIMTLGKHGYGKWWKGKLLRIILPWFLGVILFAAPVTYITFYSRGIPLDYSTFCWSLFWNDNGELGAGVMFSHIQYWYLGSLTVCYMLLSIVSKLWPAIAEKNIVPTSSRLVIPVVTLFCLANTGITNYVLGNDDLWLHFSYFFVYQPCRWLTYPLFFFVGVYAWRNNWFKNGGYCPNQMIWIPIFVLSSFFYPLWRIMGSYVTYDADLLFIGTVLSHVILLVSSVFGLIALFKQNFDFTNSFLGSMAANSYTMYYVHMEVVFPIVFLMLPLDFNVWGKYVMASALGLTASYIVGRVFLFLPFFSGSKKALVK